MKNVILVAVFLVTAWAGQAVYAQQGFGTNTPDKSAAVEIFSTKRGLLIPRISIPDLSQAAPVTSPATSLLVYNEPTGGATTEPGFYYWDGTKWVRFVSGNNEKQTVVDEGKNVKIDSTTVDGKTTYVVGVAGHATSDKKVLVTKYVNGTDNTDGTTSEWVDYSELINDFISAENGVSYDDVTGKITLGGTLTEATTTIATTGATNTLAITGLEDVTTYEKVMVLGAGGVLQAADLSSLVQADNGLKIGADATANEGKVILGGTLNEVTAIGTDGTNTLAITGLEATNEANKIVVAADAGGVLQTVVRSISGTIAANTALATDVAGYNSYVQEVNLTTTLGGTDWTLTLPDAVAANTGQVINVKIMNEDDNHSGYLNIIDNTGTLTYGALPFQGWVLKSNGTSWLIVGRN
ncbi:hypothetical protein G5B30_00040 [Sphingobacterium sp. SGG-5]|uniref:hypothetical protein n=1 Tax=Sphingobacterium sp. SGG-5 TaxID=2710881 RepID=UPI0013EE2CE9|nr:hypothetical protein [Sphingobacterium sp. SGG-5]NGM60291.1 hypothetical protein [Sphingobacterium sp. SGG-5]